MPDQIRRENTAEGAHPAEKTGSRPARPVDWQKKGRRRSGRKIVILVIVLVLLAACGTAAYAFLHWSQSDRQAHHVLKTMEQLIPGLTEDSPGSTTQGNGRDPLAALSIEGIDIVGCLEIPALNLRTPVTGKKLNQASFATWVSGSPIKGKFRIIGGRADVFRKLSRANPGDRVTFTDVDGVRYEYEVTTQYHLKDWSKADNDLLLCYKVDDQTDFVLGCTASY